MQVLSRTFVLTSLAAACLCGAALASAADTGSDATSANPRAARRAQFQQHFLDRIDSNHDGVISRAEYQAWVDGRFAKLDGDGDGVVTADEIAHSPATEKRNERRAEHFVQRFGDNGQIAKADFEAREMQRFDKAGGGADTVTADQLMPRHGGRRHHHGGHHGAGTATDQGQ